MWGATGKGLFTALLPKGPAQYYTKDHGRQALHMGGRERASCALAIAGGMGRSDVWAATTGRLPSRGGGHSATAQPALWAEPIASEGPFRRD